MATERPDDVPAFLEEAPPAGLKDVPVVLDEERGVWDEEPAVCDPGRTLPNAAVVPDRSTTISSGKFVSTEICK